MGRLVINGEEVYELDEDCLKEKYSSKVQAAFERQERGRVCPPGKHMGIQEGNQSPSARCRRRTLVRHCRMHMQMR